MRSQIKMTIAAVLAVLVIVFVLQNQVVVRVEFLMWSWTASRALILFIVFVAGATVGWLARASRARRRA